MCNELGSNLASKQKQCRTEHLVSGEKQRQPETGMCQGGKIETVVLRSLP